MPFWPVKLTRMAGLKMTTQVLLYQELARKRIVELAASKYEMGGRLTAELELAAGYEVSRPTVREAVVALKVQDLA